MICRYADLARRFTTDSVFNGARVRHPELGDKGVILPGVDKPSLVGEYHRGKKMIIIHFGSFSDTLSLRQVVAAMSILIK